MSKKELTKKGGENLPATNQEIDFSDYAGAGLENVTKDDLLIPRLTILQALSPQLNKKKTEYIEGASIGDICDVGTGEVFDAPVIFLPVKFEKVFIEWAPRDTGKGLIAIHNDSSCLDNCSKNEKGQNVTPDGNYIQETMQYYGLNLNADNRKCFISFANTQMKKARKWNNLAVSEKAERPDGRSYVPALFYRTYSIKTAEESNNQGDWAGWVIDRSTKIQDLEDGAELFKIAKEFYEQLNSGDIKADHSDIGSETSSDEAAM